MQKIIKIKAEGRIQVMILMICKIEQESKIIGMRLFDTKTKEIKEVAYQNVVKVLQSNKGIVSNLDLING